MRRLNQFYTCALELAALVLICWNCQLALSVQEPGWIYPPAIEELEGADFNITCTINKAYLQNTNQTCDVRDLYFKVGQTDTTYRHEPHMHIENDTTIVLHARNVSRQKEDYKCMCGQYVVMQVKVSVGIRPQPVEDFDCTGYDFHYMVCTFTRPRNELHTTYQVSFTVEKDAVYHHNVVCNFDAPDLVVCNMTDTDESYKKFKENYYFTIFINNTFGNLTKQVTINQFERMILAPPGQNLSVVNKTKDSICLSWSMPRRSTYKHLKWQVHVKPMNCSILQRVMWRNYSQAVTDYLCLDELPYAWYDYELHLSVRLDVNNSRWSKPLDFTFRTAPERPGRAPRVENSSFYIYSSEKQLRFYWEQLELNEHNGDNFRYIIEYIKNEELQDPNLIQVDSKLSSALIQNWDRRAYHELIIRSSNSVNASVEGSRMIIPPITDDQLRDRAPQNIRSVLHSHINGSTAAAAWEAPSYRLSWEAPSNASNLIDYTVFWCNAKAAAVSECEGSIRFERVNSSQRDYTKKVQAGQQLNMAVSANFEDFSTGMHWPLCTRAASDDLAKMEPTIGRITNSSLLVKWSAELVCPIRLKGYNLTYCELGLPTENCTTIPIRQINLVHYEIRDLKPFTTYSIKMLMYSDTKESKYSDNVNVTTEEAAPSEPRGLQWLNCTGHSVWLTWQPPLQINGILRKYEGTLQHHGDQVDYFEVPIPFHMQASTFTYELTNLTAYTNYTIRLRAKTKLLSEPSNVIQFRTSVGAPSSPILNSTTKVDRTILEWARPSIPAGPLSYYEVTVSEINGNNTLLSSQVSYISAGQNRTCVLARPTCYPLHRFLYQVRAVNVEDLSTADSVQGSLDSYRLGQGSGFGSNQQCEISLTGDQMKDIRRYQSDSSAYRLHASTWGSYEFGCAAGNTNMAIFETIEVILAIVFLGGCGYFAVKQYQKMANITVILPDGVVITKPLNKAKDLGGGGLGSLDGGTDITDINCIREDSAPQYPMQSSPHDYNCGTESSKLLLSAMNTPGNCNSSEMYHDDDYMPTPAFMAMQSSDQAEQSPLDSNKMMETEAVSSGYSSAADLGLGGGRSAPACGDYINPSLMKNWSHMPPTGNANTLDSLYDPTANLQLQPALSQANAEASMGGYVPVQILNGRTVPMVPSVSPSNYVQVSDLHKLKAGGPAMMMSTPPLANSPAKASLGMPPTNSCGYTAMEELKRGSMGAGMGAGGGGGVRPFEHQGQQLDLAANPRPPQTLGGYVTPQELNAMGHNRQVL